VVARSSGAPACVSTKRQYARIWLIAVAIYDKFGHEHVVLSKLQIETMAGGVASPPQ
jgi:hypothetical protein